MSRDTYRLLRQRQRSGVTNQARNVAFADRRPVIEHVEVVPLELVEDPRAAEPRQSQFPAKPSGDAIAHAAARGEERSCPLHHHAHHAAPLRRHPLLGHVFLTGARGYPVDARNIEAADGPVAPEILPEIRELQRRADGVRLRVEPGIVIARQLAEPDGRRDWPSDGNSRARPPTCRSALSSHPAERRSAGPRRGSPADGTRESSARAHNTGSIWGQARAGAVAAAASCRAQASSRRRRSSSAIPGSSA